MRAFRRTSVRSFIAAGLIVAAGLAMTACVPGDEAAGSSGSPVPSSVPVAADGGEDGEDDFAAGDTADGTFTGVLKYLAPGKLTVTVEDGAVIAFWVAKDTEILGGGAICGEAEGQTVYPCTDEELEAAAKLGAVEVDLTKTDGIADRVAERVAERNS